MLNKTSPAKIKTRKVCIRERLIKYECTNVLQTICMRQREWKGGEQMMRKQEMKHKVT